MTDVLLETLRDKLNILQDNCKCLLSGYENTDKKLPTRSNSNY